MLNLANFRAAQAKIARFSPSLKGRALGVGVWGDSPKKQGGQGGFAPPYLSLLIRKNFKELK